MIGICEELVQPESVSKTTGILKERQIVETTSRSRKGSLKINRSSELVKKESCRGRLIIVEGNIGVGKSTLARKMAKALGYTVFMEPTAENPYLEKFYSDPHKYALKLQLWILKQRYLTYVEAVNHLIRTGDGVILDRSVYSDSVFANVCREEGFISEDGYTQYQYWRERALQDLPIPHVTLFLDAAPGVCHSRIHKRGRECEGGVPLDYLTKLHAEYLVFLDSMRKLGSSVLQFDWSSFQQEDKICKAVCTATAEPWDNTALDLQHCTEYLHNLTPLQSYLLDDES